MPHSHESGEFPYSTRIPADISRPDRVLGPFTLRQTAILAVTALLLYGGWWLSRPFLAPLVYLVLVVPVAGTAAALALGRREGVGLDRFLAARLAYARTPKRQVHAPEGVPPLPSFLPTPWTAEAGQPPAAMHMPCDTVTEAGVLSLGSEGEAALATCSTVNFDLRSVSEQQSLTAGFARWLNSLTGPAQLLVRCHSVDLAPVADRLHQDAAALPHPALEQAARAHADYLAQLTAHGGSALGRQIVLVSRENAGRSPSANASRVVQRVSEAQRSLASAEITVTALDGRRTAALITQAANADATATTTTSEGPRS
ncbi:PrgI family protein [Streptomyces sp. NPDC002734]|uniref:PrgI family protein n=1 Tax=Streptomyces sp. NPDC002734 TaxID=3154426 RepID=UPI00332BEAD4